MSSLLETCDLPPSATGVPHAPTTMRAPSPRSADLGLQDRGIDRLRRAFCAVVGLLWMAIGAACALWPGLTGQVLPWALPPLHARCFGAMHFAAALGLWLALRRGDPAAARIPLASTAGWCLVSVMAAPWTAEPAIRLVWTVGFAIVALAAIALLWADHDVQAPAERPDRAWQTVGSLAALTAGTLLLFPELASAAWPWKLPRALALAYAGPFFGFGVSAWMLSRERRRAVRATSAPVLGALGFGVLAASTLHHATFDWASPVTWLWFGAFAVLTALACLRMRPPRAVAH